MESEEGKNRESATGEESTWRRRADSNRRIEVLQTSALTTWLRRLAIADPMDAGHCLAGFGAEGGI